MQQIKVTEESCLLGSVEIVAKKLYNEYGACCECNHPSGSCPQNNAYPNCFNCMHQIHFERREKIRIDYDCQKSIYYYACRYSWKYCSEIMYALDQVDLKKYKDLSVISIGCGSSPDLMAFDFLNRESNMNIKYYGFDINPLWSDIQEIIHDYFDYYADLPSVGLIKCNFITDNLLDCYNADLGDTNVIIVSYLVSSLIKNKNNSKLEALINLILHHVDSFNSSSRLLIMFNDVDNYEVNDFYKKFISTLPPLSDSISNKSVSMLHFTVTKWNSEKDYATYEKNHNCDDNKFNIPEDIKLNFDCPIKCTSVQCIIEVFKNSK
jgi:hypothetical protein